MVSQPASTTTTEQLARDHVRTMGTDMEAWLALLDEDVSFEFPFGASLGILPLRGKESIREAIDAFVGLLDELHFANARVFPLADPNEAFVEFDGSARVKTSGRPYEQKYLTHLIVRDGKITNIREYFDPTRITSAFPVEA